MTGRKLTTELVMVEADLSDDEFDALWDAILTQVRRHGTNGVSLMLNFVEQELDEGRVDIE
jgi:hypothetical protein